MHLIKYLRDIGNDKGDEEKEDQDPYQEHKDRICQGRLESAPQGLLMLAEFGQAVENQALNSLEREPGCRQFDVSYSDDDDRLVFLYEVYRDREAFDEHLNTPHFTDFMTRVESWLESKEVKTWNLVEAQRKDG